MEKKNILLIIFVVLVASSAVLLYRGFNSQPLTLVTPTVSSDDVIVKSQVDAVKTKINKAIGKIDTGGSLDTLTQSQQFQDLSEDAVKDISVGNFGRRNPFIPPQISGERSDGEAVAE